MISVNMFDTEINLPELVDKARAGEEVVFTAGDDAAPVFRLDLIASPKPKRLGAMYDPDFVLGAAFWEPLPDEELRLWNGEGE